MELPPESIYLSSIFSPALVHSSAWESARETGATGNLPYNVVLALSRVYGEQARYQALGGTLVQDLMVQIRRDGMEVVLRENSASFIPLQADFANREQRLAEGYEGALGTLEEEVAAGL